MAAWPWVKKDWQAYENVLRRAQINMLPLSRVLFALVLRLLPAQAPIYLAVDESLVRRWGPRVPAVGMHRDPVQSCHGRNAVNPGHKWVVLSVGVRLPYMNRPVALPTLSALYSPPHPPKRNRTGLWYKAAEGAKRIRWVVVRDPEGGRRDEVFFSTAPALTPAEIAGWPLRA